MDTIEPATFLSCVRQFFQFLLDVGFTEIESGQAGVSYRRGEVRLSIHRNPLSYEIGAVIALSGTEYDMSEIIAASAPEAACQYRDYAATTMPEIAKGLERLALLLRQHGTDALRGDASFFTRMAEYRRQASAIYARDQLLRQLRPQADAAFQHRDYAKAAELYGRIRPHLSPAETKKLTYAEAHRTR